MIQDLEKKVAKLESRLIQDLEKKVATSGDNSNFPSCSGTSGYSGGELVSLTVGTVLHLVICCTVVLKGVNQNCKL